MEAYKKIFVIIIILVIGIILVTAFLLMHRKEEIIQEENPQTIAFEEVEKVNNKTLFFQIDRMIESYINYVIEKDTVAINALSPTGALQVDTTKNEVTFHSSQMYAIDKINNITVYVEELARGKNAQEEYYFMIHIDYSNNTYEIIVSSKQEFENAKNNVINEKYKEDISIEKNEYNQIKQQETVSDFQILKKYFDDYKFNAINNIEEAFATIDATYKKAKFNNNIEEYRSYIQNNINTLQDANIIKHEMTKEEGNTKYTFVDNYNQCYELKETGIYEYTIILDNYTIESDELKQQYAKLTEDEKALSNIDKVMKLISAKDYSAVYQYLNEDFKNTNFPTLETFVRYIQENFFDNNIVGNVGIRKEGNIYMLSVPYKESLSTAADEREKIFIMKLKESTDFELSFEV